MASNTCWVRTVTPATAARRERKMVVGMGRILRALALLTLRLWSYPLSSSNAFVGTSDSDLRGRHGYNCKLRIFQHNFRYVGVKCINILRLYRGLPRMSTMISEVKAITEPLMLIVVDKR
jgi:hypothetical protein